MPVADLSPYASTPPHGAFACVSGALAWRLQSAVSGLIRRADSARVAGQATDADALLLSAWATFECN